MGAPPSRGTGESRWCAKCGELLPVPGGPCPRCLPAADDDSTLDGNTTAGTTAYPLGDQTTVAPPAPDPPTRATGSPIPAVEISALSDPSEAPTIEPAESAGGNETGTRTGTHLRVGDEFGTRYRVIRLLGMGGMGAVYQAWDHELNLAVALKVIRPDRESQSTERKFKRELVLARTVTHKNVIRIHDLGELNGTKYITMQFIEGPDLRQVLNERKKIPIDEALRLARGIALGLEAAHDAKVVHRDLKPGNILIGPEGAIITDFGIAHSIGKSDDSGVSGTVRYMAPEQARGLAVDHRADIYSFGLILHEMIVGRQWSGDMATLSVIRKKVSGETKASTTTDVAKYSELPIGVQEVLARCLPTDPNARFATTSELVHALRSLDDRGMPRPLTSIKIPGWIPLVGGRSIERGTALAIAAGALAVPVASAAVYFTGSRVVVPAASKPPISVLVADFDNRSGQAVFNGLIEQALGVALEGAPFISAYPRADAQRLVEQVAKGQRLDLERARIVAQREGINAVLAGSIVADGSGYRISLNVIDPVPGTVLSTEEQRAPGRDDVLRVVGELASETRSALGDTTPESARIGAGETFTAGSLEAAAQYTQAQEQLQASPLPRVDSAVSQGHRARRVVRTGVRELGPGRVLRRQPRGDRAAVQARLRPHRSDERARRSTAPSASTT